MAPLKRRYDICGDRLYQSIKVWMDGLLIVGNRSPLLVISNECEKS